MKHITLYRVFHGIRLLRLIKIDCRETINFFFVYDDFYRLVFRHSFIFFFYHVIYTLSKV